MKLIKVNIDDFMKEHIEGAVIPEDIMQKFNESFLKGEDFAWIRSTVFDEMKINAFYNEHPNLRPETDWETIVFSRKVIDLLKRYIKGESIESSELNDLQQSCLIIIDSKKVREKPTEELEALYEDIIWLKCDILKQ